MATRITSFGNVHIQFNDTNYEITDTLNDPKGDFTIRTKPGNALVLIVYRPNTIYWHQPPAEANWVALGLHMKVTLP